MLKTTWKQLRQAVRRSKRRQAYYEIFKDEQASRDNNAKIVDNTHVKIHEFQY